MKIIKLCSGLEHQIRIRLVASHLTCVLWAYFRLSEPGLCLRCTGWFLWDSIRQEVGVIAARRELR